MIPKIYVDQFLRDVGIYRVQRVPLRPMLMTNATWRGIAVLRYIVVI